MTRKPRSRLPPKLPDPARERVEQPPKGPSLREVLKREHVAGRPLEVDALAAADRSHDVAQRAREIGGVDVHVVARRDGMAAEADEGRDRRLVRAAGLQDGDLVVGVASGKTAKAFMAADLWQHGSVDDQMPDGPIEVTWCGVCGTGAVFRAELNGRTLHFEYDSMENANEVHRDDKVGVSLRFEGGGPADFMVAGHDSRLGQVIDNLIDNARSFAPEGGTVRVICRRLRKQVEITVDDDGPGIRPDALEKIFERFYTDRPEQGFGQNSGLGLSISKQIVEAHGGRLWAENRTEKESGRVLGARFTVRLPAAAP